jgi:hypothetical protein
MARNLERRLAPAFRFFIVVFFLFNEIELINMASTIAEGRLNCNRSLKPVENRKEKIEILKVRSRTARNYAYRKRLTACPTPSYTYDEGLDHRLPVRDAVVSNSSKDFIQLVQLAPDVSTGIHSQQSR